VTDGLFEGEEAVLHVMGGLGGAPASSQTRTRVGRASRESFPKPNTPRGSAGVRPAQAYANNPIETDHGRLKARLQPMRGLKRYRTDRVIVAGHAFVQNLRRGFYDLGTDVPPAARLAEAFDELALVI
jgi:hypothetical protein